MLALSVEHKQIEFGNTFLFTIRVQRAKLLTKVAQIFDDFLDYLQKHNFLIKNSYGYFWDNFGENWAILYYNIWSHCDCIGQFRPTEFWPALEYPLIQCVRSLSHTEEVAQDNETSFF